MDCDYLQNGLYFLKGCHQPQKPCVFFQTLKVHKSNFCLFQITIFYFFSTVFLDFQMNCQEKAFFCCCNATAIQNVFSVLIIYLNSRCIHVDINKWMYNLHFNIFNCKRKNNMPLPSLEVHLIFTLFL